MTAALPERIGKYRLLRPIARGGMAEVYEVEDPASGEHLALKLLLETGGALPRFNREYEAMIRLNHPNIVRVFHSGMHGESPWLTMELVDGTPIQGYAKQCGRAGTDRRTAEVIRTAHDLALALDHIHRRGLIHRDLKSANVLVLPDGRVKLIDFGTARVNDAVQEITREGEFIGTFAYASPEQLTQSPVDHRSDLYSLGVLLFRLATGKRPFNEKDLHALARQHVKQAPPRPRELVPGLPQELEDIILSLLAKKPEDRPNSGAEVATALERCAGRPLNLPVQLELGLQSDSLVGREDQMTRLWRVLDAVEAGEVAPGHTLLVTGAVGSGRQRAISALEKDVVGRSWPAHSWFFHRDGDPLDTLGNMLSELARSFGDANPLVVGVSRQLQLVRTTSGLAAADRIDTLVRTAGVLFQLRSKTGTSPTLVLLRSLHNAGPVGFEALVRLQEVIRRARSRVLLVGELLDSDDTEDSLARNRLPEAERIHMPPMDVQQVALLVGSMLHRRPPPGAVARRIFEASGGMPAYVEDVVRGLVKGGLLRVKGQDPNRLEWAQQDSLDIPVPHRARERVFDRFAQLPADRRRVLEALALLDGQASPRVLAAASQWSLPQLQPALDDLDRLGWIAIDSANGPPVVRWRHRLGSEVILEGLHPCRRTVLERLLVQQVAADPAFAAQIRLLIGVGRYAEAMARAVDWSVYHIAQNRPGTALEVLDDVIPHVGDAPLESGEKAQLHLLHVTALLMARPTDVSLSRSLALATKLGREEPDRFEAELHLLRARIQRVIGHYPNFRKHLMEAWYLIEHAPPSALAATVSGLLGWSNRAAGAVDGAATWHGRARRIAVQLGDAGVRAHADVGVAGWQFARGMLEESERTAMGAMEIFTANGDEAGLSLAIPVWSSSLSEQGRFSEALEVLNERGPSLRESQAPSLYVRMLLATAWIEVELCRLGRAQECVDELGATLRKGEHLDLRLEADLVWGRILLASGEHQEALHRLHFVRDRAKTAGLQLIAEWAGGLMGEVLWEMGDQRAAVQRFKESVDALARAGHVPILSAAVRAQTRAKAERVDPIVMYAPIEDYAQRQPATAAAIEYSLANMRYAWAHGADPRRPLDLASRLLNRVHAQLNATDQAALYLHPWARHLRKATS